MHCPSLKLGPPDGGDTNDSPSHGGEPNSTPDDGEPNVGAPKGGEPSDQDLGPHLCFYPFSEMA